MKAAFKDVKVSKNKNIALQKSIKILAGITLQWLSHDFNMQIKLHFLLYTLWCTVTTSTRKVPGPTGAESKQNPLVTQVEFSYKSHGINKLFRFKAKFLDLRGKGGNRTACTAKVHRKLGGPPENSSSTGAHCPSVSGLPGMGKTTGGVRAR